MNLPFRKNFRHKIENHEFVVSIEINPTKNGDFQKNFQEIALCAPFVDVVNVTDSSMARMGPASFVLAALVRRKFDIDAIFNFTCRDRNVIALKSDLLGALALGVHNVLALTGDPPKIGDHPEAKGVYEVNSLGLLKIVNELESPAGEFFPGAVVNFFEKLENAEKIVAKKVAAGAKFLISQPVFSVGRIEFLAQLQQKFNIPILAGILPIRSQKVGKYVQKIPGITVPPEEVKLLQQLSDEKIFARQIALAQNLTREARNAGLAGVHLMPLGRGDKIPEILGYNPESAEFSVFQHPEKLKNIVFS